MKKFCKATSFYFIFSEIHPKLQRNLSFFFLLLATCFTQLKSLNYSWKISWWKGLGLRFIVFLTWKQKLWNVKTICPRIARTMNKRKIMAWIVLLRGFIFLHFHATHHKRNVKKNLVYLAILPCQCGNKKSNHEKKILRPFRRIVMFTRLSSLIPNKLRHYIANTSAMEFPKSGLCWTL